MSHFVGSLHLSALWVLYPTSAIAQSIGFGPYALTVAPNAPVLEGHHPLVMISHGGRGSPLLYRTLAYALAKAGFFVALPKHAETEITLETLSRRPRQLQQALETVLSAPQFTGAISDQDVAVIGHSLGGYTALALAGAQPWAGSKMKIEVVHDERVKTLVLLAPVTSWFIPNDSLKNMTASVLLYTAEYDTVTTPWQAQLLIDYLAKGQVQLKSVANAGHYSFLSPFPVGSVAADFPPALDPPGFDRALFHSHLNTEVVDFLKTQVYHA